MRHPYYSNARALQVLENRIETTARHVIDQARRGLIDKADAIAAMRDAGMFETEIAEALS